MRLITFNIMDNIKVKIINSSRNELPAYGTPYSAGMDVRANLDEPMEIKPMQRVLVPTGLRVQLPQGYEMQLRPRSGLALKHGITLVNTPGTIDADYRGEIGVILINLSDTTFTVNNGDRICQMVITNYTHVDWIATDSIDETSRGEGGFGHTGVN
jgi:dUTP pyrophosphatase